jgi:hypothetical protein
MSRVAFSPVRSRTVLVAATAVAVCAALSAAPRTASADTILTYDLTSGSVLAGNATTPPSAFCLTGNLCPGTPAYGLATSEPLSGTVSFDLTKDTMSFDLTLSSAATFGSGPTVGSGSTLVATNQAITVGTSTNGKGVTTYTFSPGTAGDTVVANLLLSGFTETQSSTSMPAIECSASSGSTSGSCSLTMGVSTGSGSNALLINGGGTTYNGVLSVSANMTEVPLPGTAWLMLGAIGALLGALALSVRGNRQASALISPC